MNSEHVNHQNAIRKLVDTYCTWGLLPSPLVACRQESADLQRGEIEDPGHTQISNLGCHIRSKEYCVEFDYEGKTNPEPHHVEWSS